MAHHDSSEPGDEPEDDGQHPHPWGDALEQVEQAAVEAEEHAHPDETEAQARRGAARKLARTLAGLLVVGIGIALLPLPGPGWIVIIVGLSLLPYRWAERTVAEIRRRIPGIPEDGRIPTKNLVALGLVAAVFTALTVAFGHTVGQWAGDTWRDLFQ